MLAFASLLLSSSAALPKFSNRPPLSAQLDGFSMLQPRHGAHMEHIPGNPSLIVENMTGAGTLIAAKYVHSSAKPDGLTVGMFNGGLILGGAIGMKGIDFDMRELEYLGVPVQDNPVCALRKESGVTSMEQWMASKTPLKLGGLSPGNSTSDVARIIQTSLNLPVQLPGCRQMKRLAADAGELCGACKPGRRWAPGEPFRR
jgi:hypothetical protein